jgi:hypothetical protein
MFMFHDLYEMIEYFFNLLLECLYWTSTDEDDIISTTTVNPINTPINPNYFESHEVYSCEESYHK